METTREELVCQLREGAAAFTEIANNIEMGVPMEQVLRALEELVGAAVALGGVLVAIRLGKLQ